MKRTKLSDRSLPVYTRGEEIFNMTSHIVGAVFGVIALVACIVVAAMNGNAWGVVGGSIYGASLILLYTMSSVYHGLRPEGAKKVMQVLDHCTIYFLIAGTYTPILLSALRPVAPATSWVLFGIVWGLAATACVFTAIDLKKYSKLSMVCYIGIGWCIIFALKPTIQAVGTAGMAWLLAGGVLYTVGAILYGLGKSHRYMHSVFHLFVLAGSVTQFVCVLGCMVR